MQQGASDHVHGNAEQLQYAKVSEAAWVVAGLGLNNSAQQQSLIRLPHQSFNRQTTRKQKRAQRAKRIQKSLRAWRARPLWSSSNSNKLVFEIIAAVIASVLTVASAFLVLPSCSSWFNKRNHTGPGLSSGSDHLEQLVTHRQNDGAATIDKEGKALLRVEVSNTL